MDSVCFWRQHFAIFFVRGFKLRFAFVRTCHDVFGVQEVCAEASASAEKLSGAAAAAFHTLPLADATPSPPPPPPPPPPHPPPRLPQALSRASLRKSLSAYFVAARRCAGVLLYTSPPLSLYTFTHPPPFPLRLVSKGLQPKLIDAKKEL